MFRNLVALALSAGLLAWCPAYSAESAPGADDRETALWVLRQGGRVLIEGSAEYTGDPFELPDGPIRIAGADMHGTVTNGKEFEQIGKLTELREILIPAPGWSPAFETNGPYGDRLC